jgi:hypothetical protein
VPPVVVGALVILHGLITTVIGAGAVANGPAITLPSWFGWWPGPFGRSWLFDILNLGAPVTVIGGLVWLMSGVLLMGAGLGMLGVGPLREAWPTCAVAGGGLGVVALLLYFHPLYVAALVINVVLIASAFSRLAPRGLAQ